MTASKSMDRRRCGGRDSPASATIESRWPLPSPDSLPTAKTIIQDAECIRESYPGFEIALDEFINPRRVRTSTPVIGTLVPATPVEE